MQQISIESFFESFIAQIVNQEIQKHFAQIQQPKLEEDKLLTIDELLEYLPESPAKQTVYGWVNHRTCPYEKHGKRLFFRKSAIDKWLADGRRISAA